jgi:uncharacterized protein (TIGR00290 family)
MNGEHGVAEHGDGRATSAASVVLSWSSGKDSAWALYELRQRGLDVVGLLTTYNEVADRVAMHAVRRELVEAQAAAAELPLSWVPIPSPCSNEQYESRMAVALAAARSTGVTHVAFGDLFREDVRAYRVRQLRGTGLEPLFPLWTRRSETTTLSRRMLDAGLSAVVTCVDPSRLDPAFVGRTYDARFVSDLPPGVDPCGENGEFHTFCHDGPMFDRRVPVRVGETVCREGFWFSDVERDEGQTSAPSLTPPAARPSQAATGRRAP